MACSASGFGKVKGAGPQGGMGLIVRCSFFFSFFFLSGRGGAFGNYIYNGVDLNGKILFLASALCP